METPNPSKRTGLVIWMIVSQLLMLGSLLIWLLMAGFGWEAAGADGGNVLCKV